MILLWGLPADAPLGLVASELQRRGCSVALFDQRFAPHAIMDLEIDGCVRGELRWNDTALHLDEVSAAYLRPYDSRRLPEVVRAGPRSPLWERALQVEDILASWSQLTEALVVNRPGPMAANGSKPYQLGWLQSLGFRIPETLITTDPDAALAFWEAHGDVVYKSVSSVRSVVSRLTSGHVKRLQDVVFCPTQFQVYVPGVDYRVHVVGVKVFASRVTSDRDDYRYASAQGGNIQIDACDLEPEVANLCVRAAREMGLLVAGVDLRRTPDGRWYCFEVNPSPGFSFYQEATGQPIGRAIADLLEEPASLDSAHVT